MIASEISPKMEGVRVCEPCFYYGEVVGSSGLARGGECIYHKFESYLVVWVSVEHTWLPRCLH